MAFDHDDFWTRIETEECEKGGPHELANDDYGDDGAGLGWFTTCTKCWRNFDHEWAKAMAMAETHAAVLHHTGPRGGEKDPTDQ